MLGRLVVRTGTAADCDSAAAVHGAFEGDSQQAWAERLRRDVAGEDRDVLVALVEGITVGCVRVGRVDAAEPSGWWVVGLFVAAPARRRGAGSALLRAAAAHVRSRADVLHSSYDRVNEASAALHRAAGFVVVLERDARFPGRPPRNDEVTVRLAL